MKLIYKALLVSSVIVLSVYLFDYFSKDGANLLNRLDFDEIKFPDIPSIPSISIPEFGSSATNNKDSSQSGQENHPYYKWKDGSGVWNYSEFTPDQGIDYVEVNTTSNIIKIGQEMTADEGQPGEKIHGEQQTTIQRNLEPVKKVLELVDDAKQTGVLLEQREQRQRDVVDNL